MGVWFSLNGDEALEWLLQWLCFACALFLFSNDLYVVNFSRLKLFISSCRRHDRYWALWPQVMYGMQFCMSLVGAYCQWWKFVPERILYLWSIFIFKVQKLRKTLCWVRRILYSNLQDLLRNCEYISMRLQCPIFWLLRF